MRKGNSLKTALQDLKINMPMRLPKDGLKLSPPKEKVSPNPTTQKVVNPPLKETSGATHTKPHVDLGKSNLSDTGSPDDRGIACKGQALTRSLNSRDTEQPGEQMTGPPDDPVTRSPSQEITDSPDQQVYKREGQETPGKKKNPVNKSPRRYKKDILQSGKLKPADHFSAVPNLILRSGGLFETPADFMIYLHLFTYSYGFGRNTCDMGITQLMRFSGTVRNSVRKSLERLQQGKWIKQIQEFEAGGISRKWRIYTPYEKGVSEEKIFLEAGEKSGSSKDPVKDCMGNSKNPSGTNFDPPTGSPNAPYKENLKNNSKKSLSPDAEILKKFFDELKPETRRRGERARFAELKTEFSEGEIALAVEHLQEFGDLKNGDIVHSPMAYLARTMPDVLKKLQMRQEAKKQKQEFEKREEENRQREQREEREAEIELERATEAFLQTFPNPEDQFEIIGDFHREKGGMLKPDGELVRKLAIMNWYSSKN